jgi:hypothetical protein
MYGVERRAAENHPTNKGIVVANVLDSGVKLVKNVGRYNIGASSIAELGGLLARLREQAVREGKKGGVIFLVDQYFKADAALADRLGLQASDVLEFIPT